MVAFTAVGSKSVFRIVSGRTESVEQGSLADFGLGCLDGVDAHDVSPCFLAGLGLMILSVLKLKKWEI